MPNKSIYINFERGTRVLSDNAPDSSQIGLYYQEVPQWEIIFIDDSAAGVDVSAIASWSAAVDDDFDSASTPWVRVLDADIDATDVATGKIVVPVDSDTSTFLAGIGTSQQKTAYFELKGLNASGEIEVYCQFTIIARNTLDPSGGDPPDPTGNYFTKAESDIRYTRKIAGTQVTLTDDDTTNITLCAAASYRVISVLMCVDDGTQYMPLRFEVYHDGTYAYVENLPSTIGDTITGMSFDADVSGGNVRLKITMTGHGSSPKAVYNILNTLPIST